MRVLVTGGSGFLGSYVIERLVERGHEVAALTRSADAAARVGALGGNPVSGDLDDPASVDAAFRAGDAEALANIASLGFGHAPTIVSAAENAGLRKAVFVSTTSIFTTLNAPSKSVRLAAEDTIRASKLDWTIIRPTMIYGAPGDRNIARLLRLLHQSPVVLVPGGGQRLQQPVHVDDLTHAVVAAVESPASVGHAYDVAGPEPLTFAQLIKEAAAAIERKRILVPVPLRPTAALLRAYQEFASNPRIKVEQIERLAEDKAFDIGPAREDLSHDPRSFQFGVIGEAIALGLRKGATSTAPPLRRSSR